MVLLPPWLSVQRLAARRDTMAAQMQTLHRQYEHGQRLVDALQSDDPVTLELLAYRGLGLKPVGAELFDHTADHRNDAASAGWPDRNGLAGASPRIDLQGVCRSSPNDDSWLLRLADGPLRLALGVTGAGCLGLGLLIAAREERRA